MKRLNAYGRSPDSTFIMDKNKLITSVQPYFVWILSFRLFACFNRSNDCGTDYHVTEDPNSLTVL